MQFVGTLLLRKYLNEVAALALDLASAAEPSWRCTVEAGNQTGGIEGKANAN
jgi:hypothetical protein